MEIIQPEANIALRKKESDAIVTAQNRITLLESEERRLSLLKFGIEQDIVRIDTYKKDIEAQEETLKAKVITLEGQIGSLSNRMQELTVQISAKEEELKSYNDDHELKKAEIESLLNDITNREKEVTDKEVIYDKKESEFNAQKDNHSKNIADLKEILNNL